MNKNEVLDLMSKLEISPKRSLGQNFLISESLIKKIISQVEDLLCRCEVKRIIEIGPGLGALTSYLQKMNKDLFLIELDQKLAQYWTHKGLKVYETDALKWDWTTFCENTSSVLVSNLPYQISSSLVIDRSIQPCGIVAMVLMFQKEVAQRIIAPCGSPHYGLLSVIAQSFWSIEKVVDASPGHFYPSPKISSRVLCFKLKVRASKPECESEGESSDRSEGDSPVVSKAFLEFVKITFSHRRKMVLNNWKSLTTKYEQSPEKLIEFLMNLGYKETVRAQEISVDHYLSLFKSLYQGG